MIRSEAKRLTLRYFPLAWSGIALAIVVLAPLTAMWGDVASVLSVYGLSFDSFAMMLHELGLLVGLAITLRFLSRRGIGMSDLGLGTGIRASWIAYAIGGFIIAIFLYPAVEAIVRAIGVGMFWWGDGRFKYLSALDWCLAVVAAVWSLIPAYLYLRTGSLYPAMLMHALNNVFAYVVLPALL